MKKITLFTYAAFIVIFGGCYPDEVITDEDTDIVLTHHDENPDFSSFSTYVMSDTLMYSSPDFGDRPQYEDEILAAIEQHMTDLGYTRVTDPTVSADLILSPTVVIADHYAYGGCYYCWGYYPWYPGYPGYYPPYYPPTYVVSYQSGTLLISLVKVDDPVEGYIPEAEWLAVINGLVRNSLTAARVEELIDIAFEQSPYLKIN